MYKITSILALSLLVLACKKNKEPEINSSTIAGTWEVQMSRLYYVDTQSGDTLVNFSEYYEPGFRKYKFTSSNFDLTSVDPNFISQTGTYEIKDYTSSNELQGLYLNSTTFGSNPYEITKFDGKRIIWTERISNNGSVGHYESRLIKIK